MLRPITRGAADWPVFVVALAGASLPAEDIDGADQRFFALEAGPAFGGYYAAGPEALLRSVVVPPHARGRGLGRMMVEALLGHMKDQGVERVWLLTLTAEPFFQRLDFAAADRQSAPAAIAATRQFREICAGGAFMHRALK